MAKQRAPTDKATGARARRLRERAGMSIDDLAEKIHMDRSSLVKRERGECHWKLEDVKKVASGLGVEPADLLLA